MKQNATLVVTSLLSILLLTLHITDDIVRGISKAEPSKTALVVLAVFLYGTLVLAVRRSGHVIMLLIGLFAAAMPVIHMRGAHYPEIARSSGGFFFVWTLWALGGLGGVTFMLAAQGLWRMRRGQHSTFIRRSVVIVLIAIVSVRSLSGQTRSSTGAQTAPPGWSEAARTMSDLALDSKDRDVVAMAEKWVARYPEFADAHLRLGWAYESLARQMVGQTPDTVPNRMKLLETAAIHLRRGFALGGGASPDLAIRAVIDIYGMIELNRPDEQEKVVREAVLRFPAQPIAHAEMVTLLLIKGAEPSVVDKAVLAARASLPKTADARFEMATLLAFRGAGGDRVLNLRLSPPARTAMARIAVSLLDDVLTLSPGHKGALEDKARLARMQTEQPTESRLPAADEAGAAGVLRAIASAQATYSAVCAFGFYAPTLEALARPKPGEKHGFINASDVPPKGSGVLEKYGYRIEMTAPPSRKSPASCNGQAAGRSAETWSATARPMSGYAGRSYRIDVEGDLSEIK